MIHEIGCFQCLSLSLNQKIVLVISSVHLRHVLESCGIYQAEWLTFLSSECGAADRWLSGLYISLIGIMLIP